MCIQAKNVLPAIEHIDVFPAFLFWATLYSIRPALLLKQSDVWHWLQVEINDRLLKLTEDAIYGVNVDNCDVHVCLRRPCANGGRCIPLRQFYSCACRPGFNGANCTDSMPAYFLPVRKRPQTFLIEHCSCTVSKKTRQLWNGIAQNYKDRFWWHLAEIFKIL